MKKFTILIFVITLISTTLAQNSECRVAGLNVKALISSIQNLLEENAEKVAVCDPGFKLDIWGDYWRCVELNPDDASDKTTNKSSNKKDESISTLAADSSSIIGPECPSIIDCNKNPVCNSGYHILKHSNNCCCVKKDVAKDTEEDDSNTTSPPTTLAPTQAPTDSSSQLIAPDCPSIVSCRKNPKCNPGFHIVKHEDNCCCVKRDVFVESTDDKTKIDSTVAITTNDDGLEEPTICPLCSSNDVSALNKCHCISPYKKIDSIVDPKSKCCFLAQN
jgi:hypothetical protein